MCAHRAPAAHPGVILIGTFAKEVHLMPEGPKLGQDDGSVENLYWTSGTAYE